jgi:cellulose synthase/poly-beta-1,6-N-acetylglucosamine synthase-like glycosyltransferase
VIGFCIDVATLLVNRIVGRRPSVSFSTSPSITVLIPAYNEAARLSGCLESIFGQTRRACAVLVLDDCSSDATAEIVARWQESHPELRVFRPEVNSGKAHNLNAVIARPDLVSSDLVTVVDADTRLAPDCLEQLVAALADPGVHAVTGDGCVAPPRSRIAGILHQGRHLNDRIFTFRKRAQAQRRAMFVVCGALTMYRLEVLRRVPFPTRTKTEDTDHTWMLMEQGLSVAFAPAARSQGMEPETIRQQWRQLFRWYSGTYQCLFVHGADLHRSKALLYTTIMPGMLEAMPYSAMILGLPFLAALAPDFAAAFALGDVAITTAACALFYRRGLWHVPEILVYKCFSSAAWLMAGAQVTFEWAGGRTVRWQNRWAK